MAIQAALLSISDYLIGEQNSTVRHEFVAGSVYAMSGASRNHTEITRALSGLLYRELAGQSCRNLDQDVKVWVSHFSAYYYPDATISCPPHFIDDKNGVIDNPSVIFEVLSPSTASVDRGHKFTAFRTLSSLHTYILIDSESVNVEVFSLYDGVWTVRTYSDLDAVAEIGIMRLQLRLDELYAHVVI